ncbi:hypothetical protein F0562_012122 [Nyssa sinensis]|uniref:Glutamate receptor n=1 Tax=Nyssa sinensis TaxID=561372 RepID=A0A5J4ZRV5_9ASTE|nr:hypothetical protein F0562_012122 [Nyssa sinensis]
MREIPTQLCFSLFFFLSQRIFFTEMVMAQNKTIPVNVGVVLDMDEWVGRMGLRCISMALSDFYASHAHYKTRLVLHAKDSNNSVVGAAAAAQDLLKDVEVQAIIGPRTSMQANFVINLGEYAKVPIISFSATSPSLSSIRSAYFVQACLNDSSQVKAITSLIQAFGWKAVVPIYVDNEFGEGIIPFLIDALQEIDVRLPYRSVIHPSANDAEIIAELYKLMTMQTRVFIVHMSITLGSFLFTKAKDVGMMSEGYVWIITDGITNSFSLMDQSVIDSMQGVLGVQPHIPIRKKLDEFLIRWKTKSQQESPVDAEMNILGLWAYDAITALAIAVEKVRAMNSSFQKMNTSENPKDYFEIFERCKVGKDLHQTLSCIRFKGISGDFRLVNGQLQSSAFHIVNVVGKGMRGIGFWTPKTGLVKELNRIDTEVYSTSKANLKAIIWPGDTAFAPKGWVIPTNGKKLRIGVPVKDGSSYFVNVTRDPSTNSTTVTGYSIDVFDVVMATLPYHVPYEYIPFQKPDGKSAGSYDDLVYQVFLGKYDAVVGDVTIVANRSLYVDFTLPYTESGVKMIVPVKYREGKNAWIFLKPLTWDLWVTSACFFIFIAFVIWIIEHQTNEDFSGSRSHQIGTSFLFSFSTVVSAHKEKVVSNLARFVVIIWCFVVLILTQSYTASLTSMLTVQQLEPTVTSVHELIEKGDNVGYPKGSFVLALLKRLNIDESKLKVYNSTDELHIAFSKRRIVAAFDEIPYMKLFIQRHCGKYTMVEPILKTDGFGFGFPIGSPLVPDVSRAILNVTEGDKMDGIEKAWFVEHTNCPDPSNLVTSNSLSLSSFWGLFLIVGVAASFAVIIFIAMLLYEHRGFLVRLDPKTLWKKLVVMVRGIKKNGQNAKGVDGHREACVASFPYPTSPSTNCPTNPSNFSDDTKGIILAF